MTSMKAKDAFDADAYTHVALIDGVGVDAYLGRMVTDLQRLDLTIRGVEGCLASLKDLTLQDSLAPSIESHQILPLVAKTLDVHGRWPKEEALRANVYQQSSFFITYASNRYTLCKN